MLIIPLFTYYDVMLVIFIQCSFILLHSRRQKSYCKPLLKRCFCFTDFSVFLTDFCKALYKSAPSEIKKEFSLLFCF